MSLAVKQQTSSSPAPVMGATAAWLFSQSAFTFTGMTQLEAHNADQAWWPGVCECL